MNVRVKLSLIPLLAAVALVTAATMLPRDIVGPLRFEAFSLLDALGATADWGKLEKLANAALFVPVGLTLGLLGGRRWWWTALPLGAALSACVEWMQRSTPGRVPDSADLVWNTLGTAMGAALAALALAVAGAVRRQGGTRSPAGPRPGVR